MNWIGSVGRPGRVGLRYQWLHCTFCIAFILPVEQVGDIDLEGKEWRSGGREGGRVGGREDKKGGREERNKIRRKKIKK